MTAPERRKKQGLLSIDRALLVLAISAGMWAGASANKVDSQAAKVEKVEFRLEKHEADHGAQELETVRELATLKQQVKRVEVDTSKIDENLAKLANSVAAIVNHLPDKQ